MKGILTLILVASFSHFAAMANGGKVSTGTVGNDEKHLEELKNNKAILDREEQQSTEAIHKKQKEKYKVPGAQESKDSPIFRPLPSDDQ